MATFERSELEYEKCKDVTTYLYGGRSGIDDLCIDFGLYEVHRRIKRIYTDFGCDFIDTGYI